MTARCATGGAPIRCPAGWRRETLRVRADPRGRIGSASWALHPVPRVRVTAAALPLPPHGVRFVRCRACDLVYADPVDPAVRTYFDIEAIGPARRPASTGVTRCTTSRELLRTVAGRFERRSGRRPERVLLVGRWHPATSSPQPRSSGSTLDLAVDAVADETRARHRPLTETIGDALARFRRRLLERVARGVPDPATVLDGLARDVRPDALVAVAFANMQVASQPRPPPTLEELLRPQDRLLRRDNLEILMWRCGFDRVGTRPSAHARTRPVPRRAPRRRSDRPRRRSTGARATDRAHRIRLRVDACSVRRRDVCGVPVDHRARLQRGALRRRRARRPAGQGAPDRRESSSSRATATDGTREIVRSYEDAPGVRVVYQDEPAGRAMRYARARGGDRLDRAHPRRRLRVRPRRLRRAARADPATARELRARFAQPRVSTTGRSGSTRARRSRAS